MFYPYKKVFAFTRGVFSKRSPSTRKRCYIFAVRASIKGNRQLKCPCMIPKDPCACSDTSYIHSVTSGFSKSSVFTCPLDNMKAAFSKKIHSGGRFREASFVIENAVKVWMDKKDMRRQTYPDPCGRGLNHSCKMLFPVLSTKLIKGNCM